jgi:hypothetical protein
MITPSFALTATERILPRMALDFTTASLDSRVAVARAGNTATVVNSSGFVEPINANLPRFDYDPTTLVCKGLLIEESRTNLLLDSENFTSWTPFGTVTFAANAATSPANTLTADQINLTSASAGIFKSQSGSASTTYTVSVYLKTVSGTKSVNLVLNTNLSDPTIHTISVTNIWQKFTVSKTTSIGTILINAQIQDSGAGNTSIYAWGAQVEVGAFATSYIPTVASQVTRTADVATMTGTNFSSWFNASEGAFAVQASSTNTSTTNAALFSCHNTDANMIDMFNQSNGQLVGRIRANSANIAVMINGTVVDGATETYAIAYKTASMAVSNKGAAPTTSAAAYSFTVSPNTLAIGANQLGTQQINGYMRKLMFYPQRIINAEVQAFSK